MLLRCSTSLAQSMHALATCGPHVDNHVELHAHCQSRVEACPPLAAISCRFWRRVLPLPKPGVESSHSVTTRVMHQEQPLRALPGSENWYRPARCFPATTIPARRLRQSLPFVPPTCLHSSCVAAAPMATPRQDLQTWVSSTRVLLCVHLYQLRSLCPLSWASMCFFSELSCQP